MVETMAQQAHTAGTHAHEMPFGAQVLGDGRVRFRLYAPACEHVGLALRGQERQMDMQPEGGGWFECVTAEAQAGTQYRFVLPDGTQVPDPASRFQPEDVNGPSEVVDPEAHTWTDASWAGLAWHEAVIYELHIGTFTQEGTFLAAIGRLDHLRNLGVTAIEIMPVGDFAGDRGWGYDGVL